MRAIENDSKYQIYDEDKATYIFRRVTSICNHLGISASRLDIETMQTITSIVDKEYRAKIVNVSLCSSNEEPK